MFKIKRKKSVCKYLEEEFGGKWTYYPGGRGWECDDGKRTVHATCSDFYSDNPGEAPPNYYLYGDGTPKLLIL